MHPNANPASSADLHSTPDTISNMSCFLCSGELVEVEELESHICRTCGAAVSSHGRALRRDQSAKSMSLREEAPTYGPEISTQENASNAEAFLKLPLPNLDKAIQTPLTLEKPTQEGQQDSGPSVCECSYPSVHILDGLPFCDSCGFPLTDFSVVLKSTVAPSPENSLRVGISVENEEPGDARRSYEYTPLEDEDQIRLLVLHPGAFEDAIQCTILRADTKRHPQFEAVSYTWADHDGSSELCRHIKCGRAKKILPVTANCEAALRRLRLPNVKRMLWMDAICIDQRNINERNHQVRLMSRIYSLAERVVVYLGEEAGYSDLVFQLLNKSQDPNAVSSSRSIKDTALRKLLSRPWFHRIWVLQEVAVARRAVAVCGPDFVAWEALSILQLNMAQLPHTSSDGVVPCVLRLHLGPHDEQRCLWNLLRSSRSCASKDPRDKIFALRGLANDIPPGDLNADYSKSTADVFTDVTSYLISKYSTLDVIDLFYTNRQIGELPSWVPDWSSTENVEPRVYWAPRKKIHAFWKNSVAVVPSLPAPLYARLDAHAVMLGRISRINDLRGDQFPKLRPKLLKLVPIQRPEAQPWIYKGRSTTFILEDGWHSIMAEIFGGPNLTTPVPSIFKCFCQTEILQSGARDCSWCPRRIDTFHEVVNKEGTFRSRMFLTDGNSIGSGPEATQPADMICSLLGASFLAVLRPFENGFRFVGKCHVLDIETVEPVGVTRQGGTVDIASLGGHGQCQSQSRRMEYKPVSIY